MAQATIPNGQPLGAPGVIGSPMAYQFADYGNPNTMADPLGLLAGCALGSTFAQLALAGNTPAFWQKTGAASVANPSGVWTQIS